MCCEKCVKKVKDKILEVPGTGLYLSSTLAAKEAPLEMIVRRNIECLLIIGPSVDDILHPHFASAELFMVSIPTTLVEFVPQTSM